MPIFSIEQQLAALSALPDADLPAEWEQVRGQPCPRLTPAILRLGIAHRLQEGASSKAAQLIVSAAPITPGARVKASIAPGTQFERSWNGRTISVVAEAKGFLYSGKRYASLSAIAREVTGAHWSGPRFFGLIGQARG